MKTILNTYIQKSVFVLFLFLIVVNISFGQTIVYIDPTSTSSIQDGSIINPYKNFDAISSITGGYTYLVKRGTTQNLTKRIFVRPANVTIMTYGEGSRPVIISGLSIKEKILDVSLTANFFMRDIEVKAKDTVLTVVNIQGSPNTRIINCKFSNALFGVRNIDSRNTVLIDSVEIFNIQQDGIYFNGADSVIIRNSHIHHVNQAWYKDPTEQGSYGDAIQLDAAKWFYVGNNILDRSDTGNKFCFITGSAACPNSVFEKNKCYGSPSLGAHMYLINIKGLEIRYNLFSGGSRSIAGSALNMKVHYNIFDNLSVFVFGQTTRIRQEFYNNVFANCNIVLSSWSDTLQVKNNIFYKVAKPLESNILNESHNIFYEANITEDKISPTSKITDPLFVNPENKDYSLKNESPGVESGIKLNMMCTVDYVGYPIVTCEKISIGAFQMPTVTTSDNFLNAKSKNIPGFFTPDGDGKNDIWTSSVFEDHPNAQIRIYDIAGRQIKSFKGLEKGWNGYINGKLASMGVYVYIIDLKDGSKPLKGKILLN